MPGGVNWIAVDWGTTNLRAWGIDAHGKTVLSRDSTDGMSKLTAEQYPSTLRALMAETDAAGTEVLVCGMAGARQGWMEAPYMDAPADLSQLAAATVAPNMPDGSYKVRILPGVCQRERGAEDVMRGEETQLLGLSALLPGYSGLIVMPGTHSKWATLDGTRLERFSSAMTGELFDVLRTHSVLRHSFAGDLDTADREQGFDAGTEAGLSHPELLTAMLFKTRAAALLSGRSPAWCAGYLSGLLIGAEIGAQTVEHGSDPIPLIGGARLTALYARAFSKKGVTTRIIDATDATLAGLKAAREQLQ